MSERIWRVRKNHTWIDAQLRACDDADASEVRFFYDGVLLFARRWPTREEALTHAAGQLRELQRSGWNTHW